MDDPLQLVLIDDDPDLRHLIEMTLRFMAGWTVASAENGVEGVELVRRSKPDAVLVDLMMPRMDGYEVCRRLSRDPETASIPLILLTARKDVDGARLRDVGAVGVIIKPFDPDTLADRIRELREERANVRPS